MREATVPVAPKPEIVGSADVVFWHSIMGSTDAGEYEAYLSRFPEGIYAGLARIRIKALKPHDLHASTVAKIINAVVDVSGVSLMHLKSPSKARKFARPRQAVMFLLREKTPLSLPEISRMFGDRDHTTVAHACKVIERIIVSQDQAEYATLQLLSDVRAKIEQQEQAA